MNTEITTGARGLDLENYLSEWKKKCSALVQQKARAYAGKKLPHAKGDEFSRYIGFFKEWVQQCIYQVNKILNVTPKIYQIRQLREDRDRNVFKLQEEKEKLEERLAVLRPDLDQSSHRLVRNFSLFVLLLLALLAVAEGCLAYRPFLYLTGNRLASIVISAVFSIIWAIAAHKFAEAWAKHDSKKFVRTTSLILGFSAVFYAIAHLRALERASSRAMLNNLSLPGFFDVNYMEVTILTLVGWIFFAGGVWLAMRSPSVSEIKQALIQKWNSHRAVKLDRRIKILEEKMAAENARVSNAEQEVIMLLNIRKMAVKDVESYLYHMAEEFKEVNHSSRMDGQYPDCFDKPLWFNIDTMIPDLKEDLVNHFQEPASFEQNPSQVIA